CDDVYLDNTSRPPDEARCTFSHAEKMRAALAYGYAKLSARGRTQWHQGESGQWRGNPVCSERVRRYMQSLNRRKVQNGDLAISAKAITPDVLRRLWEKNQSNE
ncbi:hypothetical protein C8Q80DRAFT_1051911, partial [Daedaleopsis nitida]